jgi:hypothetical protein
VAAYEVLLLNTAVPQIQAAQAGDTYVVPRDIAFSTVASLAAGTEALPSLVATGDVNTGFWFPAADTIAASTGGTRRLTLDSSGNLGLGVTPSVWFSTWKAFQIGASGSLASRTDVFGTLLSNNAFINAAGNNAYIDTGSAAQYALIGNEHRWNIAASGTAGNTISFTQAMTLDASGNLGVGTTSLFDAERISVKSALSQRAAYFLNDTAAVSNTLIHNTATSGDNIFVGFGTEATYTGRGSISYNRAGGLVAYNTTSDYRAKDILGPVTNTGATIDALKVYNGKMKGATIERPMLVAHEAQEVTPYAVTGEKDAIDEDGKPKYQQMDVSSLVPLLIAEIQSLRARVAQLEQGA